MKAAYFEQPGGPEAMQYGDLPDPVAAPDEIVVAVHSASLGVSDRMIRRNGAPRSGPYVLGRDFSGTVASLGAGVTEFAIGDPVFGILDMGRDGTQCEKIAIKAALVARKPDTLSHADVAALAMGGLTALRSIEDTLKLKRGETILILGGSGSVGSFGVQLAKHIGARVITTAAARNLDYVRSLGADEVIDYAAQDATAIVRDCDAVFDTAGGAAAAQSYAVLKPGGRGAFVASGTSAPPTTRTDVTPLRPVATRDRAVMERIVAFVREGVVRVPRITTFRLQDAVEAHRALEARESHGRLLFAVRN